jgi:hypothetical protein
VENLALTGGLCCVGFINSFGVASSVRRQTITSILADSTYVGDIIQSPKRRVLNIKQDYR